ncbi:MAG: hypothetical protein KTR25_05540 [Myxococcales bacterium]|nr:hypothetical protein [Myxococcales bacterium]
MWSSIRNVLRLLLLSSAFVSAGCISDEDAGVRLGERHARELKAHAITLDRLDTELEEAEAKRATPTAREAFVAGYRKGITPAKAELARLYVETAAGGLGDATKTIENSIDVFVKGVVDSVDNTSEESAKSSPERWSRMQEVGRHLGRIVNGLSDAVRAAAKGFMEEVGKD